eukprot:m.132019 g.132019  ORF g.132019 m.132019 type:complete len:78 (-) comp14639_c0_seq12:871-1104(-)
MTQSMMDDGSPSILGGNGTCGGLVSPVKSNRVMTEGCPKGTPGAAYNGMIHPLLNMRLTGILWYQVKYISTNMCLFL